MFVPIQDDTQKKKPKEHTKKGVFGFISECERGLNPSRDREEAFRFISSCERAWDLGEKGRDLGTREVLNTSAKERRERRERDEVREREMR